MATSNQANITSESASPIPGAQILAQDAHDLPRQPSTRRELRKWEAALLCLGAGAAFQLAYTVPGCSFCIAIYLWCLFN